MRKNLLDSKTWKREKVTTSLLLIKSNVCEQSMIGNEEILCYSQTRNNIFKFNLFMSGQSTSVSGVVAKYYLLDDWGIGDENGFSAKLLWWGEWLDT